MKLIPYKQGSSRGMFLSRGHSTCHRAMCPFSKMWATIEGVSYRFRSISRQTEKNPLSFPVKRSKGPGPSLSISRRRWSLLAREARRRVQSRRPLRRIGPRWVMRWRRVHGPQIGEALTSAVRWSSGPSNSNYSLKRRKVMGGRSHGG